MVLNYLSKVFNHIGAVKFSILYGIGFSISVNCISIVVLTLILNDPWSTNRLVFQLILQLVIGLGLSQHIIKRIKLLEK